MYEYSGGFMTRRITVSVEKFPLARAFTISRDSKTEARVLVCTIHDGRFTGRGECVPYPRYGESPESVASQIEQIRDAIAGGLGRVDLLSALPAGAARNAVDCALWDLDAKMTGTRVQDLVCPRPPHPLETAYTVTLGDPEDMADQARAAAACKLIKVQVGSEDDPARLRAVAEAAPDSRFIVDANEGWTDSNIGENLRAAAQCRAVLVEQPLPADADTVLAGIPHPVPICADESVHTAGDLPALQGLYDAVNIKLDKTGGLTAALELHERARELGLGIMVGCMVGSSLSMAPAVLLAQDADFVDLDGPLLLARDRTPALRYSGTMVSPPNAGLWG